ncbi:hypothetical protein NEOLI_003571 [Neolecta irregularis DAH-3]|uniref:Uncharacterized protein n=1 Tax=Neolecta irregularis (strain DAH-3) TaxID=1198029 RepID=A0A1U7LTD5_NEOID|nr:hypothetical protein NEOLI_003571 [Neolecta irregularis DAH-3]|eukprot:OLL25930.1 hypothetical protein NEOLI_003571 [Neolecta irregularis DAH-3]
MSNKISQRSVANNNGSPQPRVLKLDHSTSRKLSSSSPPASEQHSPQISHSHLIKEYSSDSFNALESLHLHLLSRIAEMDFKISSCSALIEIYYHASIPKKECNSTLTSKRNTLIVDQGNYAGLQAQATVKRTTRRPHKANAQKPLTPLAAQKTASNKFLIPKERHSPVINRLRDNLGKVRDLSRQFEPKTLPRMTLYVNTPKTALLKKGDSSGQKKSVSFILTREYTKFESHHAQEQVDNKIESTKLKEDEFETISLTESDCSPDFKEAIITIPTEQAKTPSLTHSLSPKAGLATPPLQLLSMPQSPFAAEPDIDDILFQLEVKPIPVRHPEASSINSFGDDEIFDRPNSSHSPLTVSSTSSTFAITSSVPSPLSHPRSNSKVSELREMYFEMMDNTLIRQDTDLAIPKSEEKSLSQESSCIYQQC